MLATISEQADEIKDLTTRAAIAIGAVTLLLGTAITAALFAVLDVDWILLAGPVAASRTAKPTDRPGCDRRTSRR